MNEMCRNCKFLRYCKTHNTPCILEKEPTQVIENLEYCPKCDAIIEKIIHHSPTCFIVTCSNCGTILDHVDTYAWTDWEKK